MIRAALGRKRFLEGAYMREISITICAYSISATPWTIQSEEHHTKNYEAPKLLSMFEDE